MQLPIQFLIIFCINQSINVPNAEAIAEPETDKEREAEAEPEGHFIKCIEGSISQGKEVIWQETECPEGTSQCMNATNSAAGGEINNDFNF